MSIKRQKNIITGPKQCEVQGLCFRCEYRALALEKKQQPRCECGMASIQVHSCYMYKPARPIVTKVSDGYKKYPRFGPAMISAREQGVELFDGQLTLKDLKKGKVVLYWSPK